MNKKLLGVLNGRAFPLDRAAFILFALEKSRKMWQGQG